MIIPDMLENTTRTTASKVALTRRTALLSGLLIPMGIAAESSGAKRRRVVKIVQQIQRADYEGDRVALKRLYESLTPFRDDHQLRDPVGYWGGFALWRRALNGFNDSIAPAELEHDLQAAVSQFEALAARPNRLVVEAEIATSSCMFSIMFLNKDNAARVGELVQTLQPVFKHARESEPDNPRLAWVLGGSRWYNPPERGGGEAIALETYQKGLNAARQSSGTVKDDLFPSWGEPELLMNLAWSNLHLHEPDLDAAERYAKEALKLVPYWHYMRDILVPQIQDAKRKK